MPPSVKDWAIDTFGTADKAVLVVGSLIVLAVIGSIVGILAVRGHRDGGLHRRRCSSGLIGAWAVLQRPAPIVRQAAAGDRRHARVDRGALVAEPDSRRGACRRRAGDRRALRRRVSRLDRRSASTGAASCTARSRSVRRRWSRPGSAGCCSGGSTIDEERAELGAPRTVVVTGVRCGRARRAGEPTSGSTGSRPFVTPNDDFYRIDTAIVVPQVPKDSWSLHDRRHGRPRARVDVRRPPRARAGRALRHAVVRVERGRRRPRRQRPVAGRAVRRRARRGRRPARAPSSSSAGRSTAGRAASPIAAIMDGRDAMLAIGHERRAAAAPSTATRCGSWCPGCTATCRPPSG